MAKNLKALTVEDVKLALREHCESELARQIVSVRFATKYLGLYIYIVTLKDDTECEVHVFVDAMSAIVATQQTEAE